MDALVKKRLRTLQLTDWASVIEDINYNFSVLLSSPLFVGLQGDDGVAGATGPAGARGSKWMFVDVDNFRTVFPSDVLTGAYDITASYLTQKLQKSDTRAQLLVALNAGSMLVDGDVIVSNSKILLVDLANNAVIDTGESINSNQDVFMQSMQRQIKSLVDEYLRNNTDLNNNIQTVACTTVEAKNYPDSSAAGINNIFSARSIFDIPTNTSGPGAGNDSYKLFYPSPNVLGVTDSMMWLFGPRERYHEIAQHTLEYSTNNPSDNTTSDFGPNAECMPALCVLQNDDKSGIIIGSKTAKKFTEFGRAYINAKHELCIISPYNDSHSSFSEILLGSEYIKILTKILEVGGLNISGNLRLENGTVNIPGLEIASDGAVTIGTPGLPFNIVGSQLRLPGFGVGGNATFLTIKEGLIQASPLSLTSPITEITGVPNDAQQVVTSDVLYWVVTKLITGLDNSVLSGDGIISNVISKIDDLRKTYEASEKNRDTQISNITSSISGLSTTISGYDSKIADALTGVKNAKDELATYKSKTDTSISALGNSIETVSDNLKSTKSELETAQSEYDKKTVKSISDIKTEVDTLSKKISGVSEVAFMPAPGMIIDLWVDSSSFDDTLRNMFDANGQGLTDATYTLRGKSIKSDLSAYYICDGRNGLPNLCGKVIAGATSEFQIGATTGDKNVTLSETDIPKHSHPISGELTTSEVEHSHDLTGITTTSDGAHIHDVEYNPNSNQVGGFAGELIVPGGEESLTGFVKESGDHTHKLSGNIRGGKHSHDINTSGLNIGTQHNKSQTSVSVMQPTVFCLKLMYIGKE